MGKTSIIKRFVENSFKKDYISTLGVQLSRKSVQLSEKIKMNFIIWDIGGQSHFDLNRKNFYTGANAALIIVDRTRSDHLKSIEKWYNDDKMSVTQSILVVLVGNKSDLSDQLCISESEIEKVAKRFNFHYILTSAKTGENVNDVLLYIAYRVIETL